MFSSDAENELSKLMITVTVTMMTVTSGGNVGDGMLFAHFHKPLFVAEKLRAGNGDAGKSSAQAELDEQRNGGRMFLGNQN